MCRHFITVSCGFLVMATFIVGIDSSDCQTYSYGRGRCFMYCDSGNCHCEIEAGLKKCNQHCSPNATDCPNMLCSGTVDKYSSCVQYCFDNHGRCKMTCYDVPMCIQECASGNPAVGCDDIKCEADFCSQSCANCTMECTSEVKQCQQTCRGGKCEAKCFAKECTLDCSHGTCEQVGVTDAPGTNNSTAKECTLECSRGTCVGVTDAPGTNNSTASHMHLMGDYYSKPLLPTLCFLMRLIY